MITQLVNLKFNELCNQMEKIIEKLETLAACTDDDTSLYKLYADIYMILTDNNKKTNYNVNKSGVRFKLNIFDHDTIERVLVVIDSYKESEKNLTEFTDN